LLFDLYILFDLIATAAAAAAIDVNMKN